MIRNWLTRLLTGRFRNLFRFWNGRQFVRVDPLVIYRRLSEHDEFDQEGDFKRLRSPNPTTRLWAIGHMADVVRDAFGLPVYDGRRGLTEEELVGLISRFNLAMAALKKNTLAMPGSSPSTEAFQSPVDSPDVSDTNATSVSGSIPDTP